MYGINNKTSKYITQSVSVRKFKMVVPFPEYAAEKTIILIWVSNKIKSRKHRLKAIFVNQNSLILS